MLATLKLIAQMVAILALMFVSLVFCLDGHWGWAMTVTAAMIALTL